MGLDPEILLECHPLIIDLASRDTDELLNFLYFVLGCRWVGSVMLTQFFAGFDRFGSFVFPVAKTNVERVTHRTLVLVQTAIGLHNLLVAPDCQLIVSCFVSQRVLHRPRSALPTSYIIIVISPQRTIGYIKNQWSKSDCIRDVLADSASSKGLWTLFRSCSYIEQI